MKKRFFKLAKKLSEKSSNPKHQLGCVIVKGNKILGVGFNRNKTHTRSTHPFKFLHSECDAIISAGKDDLTNATAYIYRQTKNGELALARPCQYCMKALKDTGIKKIYFTTYKGYLEEVL